MENTLIERITGQVKGKAISATTSHQASFILKHAARIGFPFSHKGTQFAKNKTESTYKFAKNNRISLGKKRSCIKNGVEVISFSAFKELVETANIEASEFDVSIGASGISIESYE